MVVYPDPFLRRPAFSHEIFLHRLFRTAFSYANLRLRFFCFLCRLYISQFHFVLSWSSGRAQRRGGYVPHGSAGVSLPSGSSNLDSDPDHRTHGSTVARPRTQNVHGTFSSTAPVGRNKAFSQKLSPDMPRIDIMTTRAIHLAPSRFLGVTRVRR